MTFFTICNIPSLAAQYKKGKEAFVSYIHSYHTSQEMSKFLPFLILLPITKDSDENRSTKISIVSKIKNFKLQFSFLLADSSHSQFLLNVVTTCFSLSFPPFQVQEHHDLFMVVLKVRHVCFCDVVI